MGKRKSNRLSREIKPVQRIRKFYECDRAEHEEAKAPEGLISVQRTSGIGGAKVQPRPHRTKPDDETCHVESNFSGGCRGKEEADVTGRPSAAGKEERQKSAACVRIGNLSDAVDSRKRGECRASENHKISEKEHGSPRRGVEREKIVMYSEEKTDISSVGFSRDGCFSGDTAPNALYKQWRRGTRPATLCARLSVTVSRMSRGDSQEI